MPIINQSHKKQIIIGVVWIASVAGAYLVGVNKGPAKVSTSIDATSKGSSAGIVNPKGVSITQKSRDCSGPGPRAIVETKIDFLSADKVDLEAWQNSLKEKQVVTATQGRVNLLGTYGSNEKPGVEVNGNFGLPAGKFEMDMDKNWRIGAGVGINY